MELKLQLPLLVENAALGGPGRLREDSVRIGRERDRKNGGGLI